MKHFKLGSEVRVHWLDSTTVGGWRNKHSDFEVINVVSVGRLVKESPVSITLASTLAASGEAFLEALSIPRGCIVRMEKL